MRWILLLAAGVFVTGCLQPSVFPLLKPADTAFDDRLLGSWACSVERWTFAAESADVDGRRIRYYKVQIAAAGKTGALLAWIGALGSAQFVDFFPDPDTPISDVGFVNSHLAAMHTFGRVRVDGDHLRLDMLDSDWVAEASQDRRIALAVKTDGDRWLLTAPTDRLQAFARKQADDERVFGEHIELVRPGSPELKGGCSV